VSAASWRKVALKALAWGVGALALMVALAAFKHHGFRLGKVEVLFAVGAAAVEVVHGVLHERGWVMASKTFIFIVFVGVLGLGRFLDHKTEARELTDGERTPLVAVGEGEGRRLRHPTLGFSIRDPGAAFKLVVSQAFAPTAQYDGYQNAAGDVNMVVGLVKGIGDSEASLREFLTAMKDAPVGSPTRRLDVTRLETSGGAAPEGRLRGWIHGTLGEVSYRLSAHGFTKDGTSYAFFVAVASVEPDALAEVLTSFEPSGPP
jgi:hypothetical protein